MLARAPRLPPEHLLRARSEDYRAAQEGFAAEHPWFTVHRLAARSHLSMFEVPEALAAHVEEPVCRLT